jgi:hypothetical protein
MAAARNPQPDGRGFIVVYIGMGKQDLLLYEETPEGVILAPVGAAALIRSSYSSGISQLFGWRRYLGLAKLFQWNSPAVGRTTALT